jgi:tetratricopeptide (TPR) repeat protein
MAKSKKTEKSRAKKSKAPTRAKPLKRTRPARPATKATPHHKGQGAKSIKHRHATKRSVKLVILAERNPQAVKMYEAALKDFSRQEYAKSRDEFENIVEQFPREGEIAERSRVHLAICQQKLSRNSAGAKTADDHYNLAIAHLNRRELDQAEEFFRKALNMETKGDHIFYGLAAVEALRGNLDQAIKNLLRAIQLNPLNRASVLHDPDFETIVQTTEFHELLRSTTPGI